MSNKFSPDRPITFAEKIDAETALVYDLRVKLNGEDRYFIIKIDPDKQQEFLANVENRVEYILEDYGEILYRGWDEPSDELKERLRQLYGMFEEK